MDYAVTWGPRFAGIDSILHTHSLIEVCGLQWRRSVETCLAATESLPSTKVLQMRYEDLVREPAKEFRMIADFLGIPFTDEFRTIVMNSVRTDSVAKWMKSLTESDMVLLDKHISDLLRSLGYK